MGIKNISYFEALVFAFVVWTFFIALVYDSFLVLSGVSHMTTNFAAYH